MRRSGKDSEEVVAFMTLFGRLKDWSDDTPEVLAGFAATDSSVMDLCLRLASAADVLREKERGGRELFTAPVDPKFLVDWRDYEDRYETAVSGIWVESLFAGLGDLPWLGDGEPPKASKEELRWKGADFDAEEQADSLEEAIDFAWWNASDDTRWHGHPEDVILRVQEGVEVWERLRKRIGLDVRGVSRRRSLVPFVLVPRKVAAKYGDGEALSLLTNLRQAHDAFVYGAPYAALALMRSIMEVILRDHYGAEGRDLEARIRSVQSRLPRPADHARLHRLRQLANAVLHLDPQKDGGLSRMDQAKLEREIVGLLFVLRVLIEEAP